MMLSRPTALLFDFDGTLIDSARSVLAGLGHALKSAGIAPKLPLDASIIGPPLKQTLARLAGTDEPALIDTMSAAFREHYDLEGYRDTDVYPGVPELLSGLHDAAIPLYIVTNKRIAPTRLILEHLGWLDWFTGVYALDALEPPAAHKPALVAHVLTKHALAQESTWMVGDSSEDRRSAELNGLRFFAANWGYGSAGDGLDKPLALLERAGLA
jgi:phosphoglycolate phosphatase